MHGTRSLLEPRSKELAERRHGGLFLSIGHGQQLRRPKHDAIVSRPSRWPSGATPSHTRARRPAGMPATADLTPQDEASRAEGWPDPTGRPATP